jgi:hypothetical protein
MEKKTCCLILILALCCAVQAFAAEPASEESTGCVLTPARLGALVAAPSLCAPETEQSPVVAAEQEIFGNPGTEACCSLAERNECYAYCAPGCGHWYCDLVCICECLC